MKYAIPQQISEHFHSPSTFKQFPCFSITQAHQTSLEKMVFCWKLPNLFFFNSHSQPYAMTDNHFFLPCNIKLRIGWFQDATHACLLGATWSLQNIYIIKQTASCKIKYLLLLIFINTIHFFLFFLKKNKKNVIFC